MPAKKVAKKIQSKNITLKNPSVAVSSGSHLVGIFTKKKVIIIVAALAVIGLLYYFKGQFIVATVNNQPISRFAFNKELEKQAGKQVLDQMLTKTLITQEAQKSNITVSDKEIDDQMTTIQKQLEKNGQNLDQMLLLQGMTKDELKDQVKIQKIVEKMFGKDVKVTDKEINDYIEKNQESLPKDIKPEDLKIQVKEQLAQQKLSEKFTAWLQKAQKEAKINYFIKL